MTVTIRRVDWATEREKLIAIRFKVFVEEQAVPIEEELDGMDEVSSHFLAFDDDQPIGTARLMPSGQIGRMAVLKQFRRRGIGALLLKATVEEAKAQGCDRPFLHAQTHALDFYQANGFVAYGGIFLDAGIAHRAMRYRS